jgi:hypothetical protein
VVWLVRATFFNGCLNGWLRLAFKVLIRAADQGWVVPAAGAATFARRLQIHHGEGYET